AALPTRLHDSTHIKVVICFTMHHPLTIGKMLRSFCFSKRTWVTFNTNNLDLFGCWLCYNASNLYTRCLDTIYHFNFEADRLHTVFTFDTHCFVTNKAVGIENTFGFKW